MTTVPPNTTLLPCSGRRQAAVLSLSARRLPYAGLVKDVNGFFKLWMLPSAERRPAPGIGPLTAPDRASILLPPAAGLKQRWDAEWLVP